MTVITGPQGDTEKADDNKGAQKSGDQKASEQKPVEQKADEKPAGEKPKEEKPVGEKPVEEKKADDKGKDGKGKAEEGDELESKAPDKYSLEVPEGGHVDASDVKAFETLARARNWTNEQAQAVLTEHAEALAGQSARFLDETKAHAEIGGDKLEAAQVATRAVLDRFLPATTPEGKRLRTELNKNGYGNFAPLVLLLARIGNAMGEDSPGKQQGGGKAAKSLADVLYDNSTSR